MTPLFDESQTVTSTGSYTPCCQHRNQSSRKWMSRLLYKSPSNGRRHHSNTHRTRIVRRADQGCQPQSESPTMFCRTKSLMTESLYLGESAWRGRCEQMFRLAPPLIEGCGRITGRRRGPSCRCGVVHEGELATAGRVSLAGVPEVGSCQQPFSCTRC